MTLNLQPLDLSIKRPVAKGASRVRESELWKQIKCGHIRDGCTEVPRLLMQQRVHKKEKYNKTSSKRKLGERFSIERGRGLMSFQRCKMFRRHIELMLDVLYCRHK